MSGVHRVTVPEAGIGSHGRALSGPGAGSTELRARRRANVRQDAAAGLHLIRGPYVIRTRFVRFPCTGCRSGSAPFPRGERREAAPRCAPRPLCCAPRPPASGCGSRPGPGAGSAFRGACGGGRGPVSGGMVPGPRSSADVMRGANSSRTCQAVRKRPVGAGEARVERQLGTGEWLVSETAMTCTYSEYARV